MDFEMNEKHWMVSQGLCQRCGVPWRRAFHQTGALGEGVDYVARRGAALGAAGHLDGRPGDDLVGLPRRQPAVVANYLTWKGVVGQMVIHWDMPVRRKSWYDVKLIVSQVVCGFALKEWPR